MSREFLRLQDFSTGPPAADFSCLILGSRSGKVVATGTSDGRFETFTQSEAITCLAFDPTEHLLASCAVKERKLNLFDLDQAKVVRNIDIDSTSSAAVAFHPIGLVTSLLHDDGKLTLWDARSKSIINTFTPTAATKLSSGASVPLTAPRLTKFSPDGAYAFASHGDIVLIWDLASGRLAGQIKAGGIVKAIDFHPTELVVVVGTSNGLIEFWSCESWTRLSVYAGPIVAPAAGQTPTQNGVQSLSFSADGDYVLAAFSDGLRAVAWTDGASLAGEVGASKFVAFGEETSNACSWRKISGSVVTNSAFLACGAHKQTAAIWFANLASPILNLKKNGSVVAESITSSTAEPEATITQTKETSIQLTQSAALELGAGTTQAPAAVQSEEDRLIEEISTETDEITALLTNRLTSLRGVKAMWASKGTLASLLSAINRQPASLRPQLLVDLLSTGVIDINNIRTVDDATAFMSLVQNLLNSGHELHVTVAIDVIRTLFKTYGTACSDSFTAARRQIHPLMTRPGEVGQLAKAAFKEMQAH